jgi:hypothetical protein
MYFPGSLITGNWLSGGSSSRYPPGNRFEEPFDISLTGSPGSASALIGRGANVRMLLSAMQSVRSGLLVIRPDAPDGVRVIF